MSQHCQGSDRATRPLGQFSLQTLLAAFVFVALGLWSWRLSGVIGVTMFVALVTIVACNLGIALLGAKLGCPFLAGAVGGAVLWSIAAACLTFPDRRGWNEGHTFLEDLWIVAIIGVLAGLVCGIYGSMTIRQRQLRTRLRKAIIYCLAVLSVLSVWLGWKFERARRQREVVTWWVTDPRGKVKYDHQVNHRPAPGREWLRQYLGMDFFDNVVSLTGRQLRTDASPLVRLSQLKELKTRLSDVSSLAGLRRLESLDLEGPQLKDVSPLAQLGRLESLRIRMSPLRDVSPLTGLANLRDLNLYRTSVRDLSPLAGLTDLKSLSVAGTQVRDVLPLARLTNLQRLELGGTLVKDMSPLARLPHLRHLDLSRTSVSDLSPLAGMTELRFLYLRGIPIKDLSPLTSLTNLQHLDLRQASVRDLSPLAGLTGLRFLYVEDTSVSEAELEKLQKALPQCQIRR